LGRERTRRGERGENQKDRNDVFLHIDLLEQEGRLSVSGVK
jgi:hypothetical protein